MYNMIIKDAKIRHELDELFRVFIKPVEFVYRENRQDADPDAIIIEYPSALTDLDEIKRNLYETMSFQTGYKPPWGILTGVRPTKKCNDYLTAGMPETAVRKRLIHDFYVSADKTDLILETCRNQKKINQMDTQKLVGIYIGIPFCPSRCTYCSFASNEFNQTQIDLYLTALFQEIDYVSLMLKELGLFPESIYFGGGTPTALSEGDLDRLLSKVRENFDFDKVKEFTVEAGRPDTITIKKLESILKYGGTRISINPQSMNQKTLQIIGRNHTPASIIEAFNMAASVGIPVINADIIAGLPEEDIQDFMLTVEQVLRLQPQNITVHTLAMKRASKLKAMDKDYQYDSHASLAAMLTHSRASLNDQGYKPYYLYRQKQTAGNFENVGYARGDTQGIYNVRIMEERQSIIALGAGGISKVYFPLENRHERVPNVSDLHHYITRIQEMIKRKEAFIARPLSGLITEKTEVAHAD